MMNRMSNWGCLVLMLLASPSAAPGQYLPYLPPYQPYIAPPPPPPSPRELRRRRNECIAYLGGTPAAQEFVEAYGEAAVAAVCACSKPVAVKLVEFHASGGLNKLAKPRELLQAIAGPSCGDDPANWIMANGDQLDTEAKCTVFLRNPLDYSLNLKRLEDGMGRNRGNGPAQVNRAEEAWAIELPPITMKMLLGWGAAIAVLGLLFYRWSGRSRAGGL